MHKIKSITITGFRRQETPIKLDLDEEANFLIGRNGTGKTSLINLINACLTIDQEVLTDTIFQSVIVRFKMAGKTTVPILEVEKLDYKIAGAYVRYSYKDSASAKPEVFELSFGRRRMPVRTPDGQRRIVTRSDDIRALKAKLEDTFSHTWLSLHRGHELFEGPPFAEYEYEYEYERPEILPGVDRKLADVLQNLRQYFFELDRKVSDLTSQFQKDWFLSFLATEASDADIISTEIDFEEEKNAIIAIFERFEVPAEAYEEQLENHVELGVTALETFRKRGGFPISKFFNLYDVVRLHRLVEQWQQLQERQKEILEPKIDFINIASGMLYKKSIAFNQANEIAINADDRLKIPVEKLSSGEKQLIIFLAETLLQEKQPFIFLADEPELSLHVEWQEQLVSNLLKVNPNAQVLFATHSPDIVGEYGDHIFSMERLVE
ncbi:AAA family ATPase [Celeribacter arenosi]|uniref:ATPase AAA-type core domain-containing protein n=1 Tax=Celeribacter arenosi TaxID=792649 RepID=A0ABP7K4D2_9RHOB